MTSAYFPGMGALRLYTAVRVVFAHAYVFDRNILLSAHYTVTLFFVISGFLITYLFLEEQRKTGTINVREFYRKRAYRILPLYFLVVIVGYTLPFLRPEMWTLPFTATFNASIPVAIAPQSIQFMGHLWSIGVEVVFYLTWPLLMRRFPMVGVCFLVIGIRLAITTLFPDAYPHALVNQWRFECMAVGALAAWAVFHRHAILKVIYHPLVAWGMVIPFALININLLHVDQEPLLVSVIFAVMILNICTNPRFPKLDFPILNHWGKRTYSIYAWHYLIMGTLLWLAPGIPYMYGTAFSVVLTFIVADLSFTYIEKPFMARARARPAMIPEASTT